MNRRITAAASAGKASFLTFVSITMATTQVMCYESRPSLSSLRG